MRTKLDLVKDVFFAATTGKRTPQNYPEGMAVMEAIAANNYKWAIQDWNDQWGYGRKTAGEVLDIMADMTYINLSGVNGATKRAFDFWRDYMTFKG